MVAVEKDSVVVEALEIGVSPADLLGDIHLDALFLERGLE